MRRYTLTAALFCAVMRPATAGGLIENFETPAECQAAVGLKIEACLAALGGGLDAEVESRLSAVLAVSAEPDGVRAAQDAWVAYRKATCDYFAGQEGMAGIIQGLQCLRWTSWGRMKELDGLLGIKPAEDDGEGEAARGLEPDFSTLADTQYSGRAFSFGDFSWYIKKRYGAVLVEKALVARGFDTETATGLAGNWDAWRYHPENGQPLIESAPLGASDADLQGLAAKFPECMRDLGKADCRINYSIEIGCKLDPAVAKECQSVFDIRQSIAAGYQRDGHTAYMLSGFQPQGVYDMAGCIMEGGKGAGVPLFAPDNAETVAKLTFIAQPGAGAAETERVDIEALPEREAELCSVAAGWKLGENGSQTSSGLLDLAPVTRDGVFSQYLEEGGTPDPSRDGEYNDFLQRVTKAVGEAGQ